MRFGSVTPFKEKGVNKACGDLTLECGHSRTIAQHGIPVPYAPLLHETVRNVRIGFRECLGGVRRRTTKNQNRSIRWIRESPRHDQFAAVSGLLDQAKMLGAKRPASFDVIFPNVIKQEDMHR